MIKIMVFIDYFSKWTSLIDSNNSLAKLPRIDTDKSKHEKQKILEILEE
jgi:hypothetical protein